MNWLELFFYLLAMSGTPGPNTILSLQNASEKGLRKGIYLNYGMVCGITMITVITYALVSVLASALPHLENVLQALSIIYILYLAWKMYRKSSIEMTGENTDGSFRRGLLLQLVNVKVMMLALSTISTYVLPYGYGKMEGLMISLTVPLMCFVTGLMWAVAGNFLKNIYNDHRKGANTIFSLSLLLLALRSLVNLIASF